MMKETYERAELEILKFETEDVILASDDKNDPEDEYMLPVR